MQHLLLGSKIRKWDYAFYIFTRRIEV